MTCLFFSKRMLGLPNRVTHLLSLFLLAKTSLPRRSGPSFDAEEAKNVVDEGAPIKEGGKVEYQPSREVTVEAEAGAGDEEGLVSK